LPESDIQQIKLQVQFAIGTSGCIHLQYLYSYWSCSDYWLVVGWQSRKDSVLLITVRCIFSAVRILKFTVTLTFKFHHSSLITQTETQGQTQ